MVRLAEKATRGERIAAARRAERLKEEIEVHIRRLDQKYKDDWSLTKDADEREQLWLKCSVLKDMVTDIVGMISDGQYAVKEEENER